MKKPKIWEIKSPFNYEREDGETIEVKVARVTENNEPISDGAPIIFTEKKDGVIAAYNPRTDRWDIAQEAMSKKYAADIEKLNAYLKGSEQKADDSKSAEGQTAEPSTSTDGASA